jgi:hypothetical protein
MNEIESPQILRDIINYAYCGSINININNVQNLLTLSSLLQINELVDACSEYMEQHLDYINVINLFYFSTMHNCLKLKQKCKEFIDKYFDFIYSNDDLLKLDSDQLIELLDSDDLNIENEEIIIKIVFKWIFHDLNKRYVFQEDLFKLIRLNLIENKRFEIEIFLNENNLKCCENEDVDIFKDCLKSFEEYYTQNISMRYKKRAGMTRAEKCFIIIGGNYEIDDGANVNCVNINNNEKFLLSNHFQDKSKNSKGYFHVENPGLFILVFFFSSNLISFH